MVRRLLAGCVLLTPLPTLAGSLSVPGDFSKIRWAAQAAAAGDTILVACGTYEDFLIELKPGVVLRSADGHPDCVTIDGGDQETVLFGHNLDASTLIEGITITGGRPSNHGGGFYFRDSDVHIRDCVFEDNYSVNWGGGIAFQGTSSPTIERCVFRNNEALYGGGLYCEYGSPTVDHCLFEGNRSRFSGGGMAAWYPSSSPLITNCVFRNNESTFLFGGGLFARASHPTVVSCTFTGNAADEKGAAIHARAQARVTVKRSLIAFNVGTESVFCTEGGQVQLACSNVYKNGEGNWTGCIQDQAIGNGNFSEDPLFCDADSGDLTLRADSPCAADAASGCGLVGALDVGCGAIRVEVSSWGQVKAAYR
ncbi:MAG: hypothetical protein DHS20C21_12290 [Gemmatimonadota bacterium]|nr:MAG: hypothetical protein DHS20C21_12290 [Gemmatimonadota bacterium]